MGDTERHGESPLASGATADVFVSFAHVDRDFVVRLHDALRQRGRNAWVDWEGIPPSAEWMAEIEGAILRAQAFVFVVSPHSASSPVCAEEAEIAARHNKKLIPIVAEDIAPESLPPEVAARQWIDARPELDFVAVVDTLLATIDTDLEWIRMHTRLLQQALRWTADRERTSLLEERELEDAEVWLGAAGTHEVQPTPEQVTFIAESRWGATLARSQEHYERSFELVGVGRPQAAAAHLLRAVELAPPGGAPEGHPVSEDNPGWAEDAWTAYRYLDAERGHLHGRLNTAGPVSCVAVNDDRTVAVVGCATGGVELWDLESCERIRMLSGLAGAVTAVAVSPAREIVAASADGSLVAWPADRETPRSLFRSTDNPVTAIAFGPDGTQAFGLRDGQLMLRGAAGENMGRSYRHGGSITSISFDAAGRTLMTCSGRSPIGEWLAGGTATAWDRLDDTEQLLLPGTLEGSPVAVALSPDGQAVLRSLSGGVVEVFSGSPQERQRLGHRETVRAVAFSAQSDTAITGCDDGTVHLWRVEGASEVSVFDGHLGPVTCLVASSDGAILLSGSLDSSVAVWQLDRSPDRRLVADGASALAVSATNETAVGSADGGIRLVNRPAGQEPVVLRQLGPAVSVSMSPDGAIVLTGHNDGGVAVWDVESGRRVASLAGHDGTVWDLAYSSDGTLAASASEDGSVHLWRTSSWTIHAVLDGHDGAVHGVTFMPDGRQLVSSGNDGTVRLWNVVDGNEVRRLGLAKTQLVCVAVSPDATKVAAGGGDGTVRIWSSSGRETPPWKRSERKINAHRRMVTKLAISPDGRLIVSASLDATVKYWDLATGRKLRTLTDHTDSVYDLAVGPDGQIYSAGMDGAIWVRSMDSEPPRGSYTVSGSRGLSGVALSADGATLAAASLDGRAHLWNAATGAPLRSLSFGHTAAVDGLAFNADATILASVSRDRTVRLWSVESEEQVVTQPLPSPATSVAWHPTKLRLVCGAGDKNALTQESLAFGAVGGRMALRTPGDGGAVVWDFHGGPPRFLERHAGVVSDVAVTADGRVLSAGDDASVRVWDPGSGRQLRLLSGHRDRVWAVAVSPDSSLAASGSIDADVRLWDLESGLSTRIIEHHEGGVGSVVFDSSGTRLVTGSADGTVRIFDVASGAELRVLRGHKGCVTAVAVDHDATRVLSGTLDGELLLWDLTGTGQPRVLQPHDGNIWGVAIGPDSRTAVTTSEDGTARVWDLDAMEVRHTLTARHVPLRHAAISPDGSEVAVGSADYAVRVWDLRSGDLTAILTGHWSEAISVAYDPDGTVIVCGAEDGTVLKWARGHEDPLDWVAGRLGDVLAAEYDPSGEHILVGGADGSLRLWDEDRGELVSVLRGHTAPVTGLCIHPAGRRAASSSMDGSVRLWDLVAGQELLAFTDNQGPVAGVLFLDEGRVIVSASVDGTQRVRSTRTGRLLRTIAGQKRANFDLVLAAEDGATMQLSFGNDFPVLAARPDDTSVLTGTSQEAAELPLLRPDTPRTPPRVDTDLADPYADFQHLYRSIGMRVAPGQPGAGDVTLV